MSNINFNILFWFYFRKTFKLRKNIIKNIYITIGLVKKKILLKTGKKNDRNGGIWQSGISKSQAEHVQRHACFVNVQSSLYENVIFSVCACMCNAAYVIFIMWNSISGKDACYHFRLNISCGVAVTVRSHKKNSR